MNCKINDHVVFFLKSIFTHRKYPHINGELEWKGNTKVNIKTKCHFTQWRFACDLIGLIYREQIVSVCMVTRFNHLLCDRFRQKQSRYFPMIIWSKQQIASVCAKSSDDIASAERWDFNNKNFLIHYERFANDNKQIFKKFIFKLLIQPTWNVSPPLQFP